MEDSTYPDPYVQKFLKNFEIAKINAEVDTMTAARYGVKSYPTVAILKPNGSEIDRIVGYYPPTEFVTAIVEAMSGIGTLDDLLNQLASRPNDPQLVFDVGQKYRWRGEYSKASSFFNHVIDLDKANSKYLAGKSIYALAHMKFKEKNYPAAIETWKQLVLTFPADSNSQDAELMVGVCFRDSNDNKNAKLCFTNFLKKYPNYDDKDWVNEQIKKLDEKKKK
jgi:tetratricopeptide (TPR) repeat protein